MAKILLTTFGSHGDLHPYLGMAKILKENGYQVILTSHPHYREMVERVGVDFFPLKPSFEEVGPEETWANQANHPQKGIEFIFKKLMLPYLRDNYESITKASENCDLIISHLLTVATPMVAEKKGIPYVSSILQPATFLSSYDPPALAPLPFLPKLKFLGPSFFDFVYTLISKVSESWFKDVLVFRKELGLSLEQKNPFVRDFSKYGNLALFDEEFSKPTLDWPNKTYQVGFPLFDEDLESDLSPKTKDFLAKGEAPLVFTLGTAVVLTDTPFFEIAYKALKQTNNRAIFLVGKKAKPLSKEILNDEKIHITDYEPFSKLFHQAKIIVHQCGVGTTAQALLSGKPQILVPFAHDQPDNARIVSKKGIGVILKSKKLTEKSFIEAINEINNNADFAKNAFEFSEIMKKNSFEEKFLKAIEELLKK